VDIRSVAVWVNVFIPWDISGMTVTVPAGPHAGKTALDGTALLLTDQRAFSNNPKASSRMHSCVTIDLSGSEPCVTVTHRCDWAITCDREEGEVVCRARADTRRMTASLVSMDPVHVRLECAASHPCPGVLPALKELEYRGTVLYRRDSRALSIDLMVGLFPAFEGYGAINDGPAIVLFRQAPPAGIAASPSARGAHRRIRTVVDDSQWRYRGLTN
jgi:hypothetical protein